MDKVLSYCGQMVRERDPDRFLLSLFAPEAAREDLWALFAFHHEIAKTREVVTETQLGLIRLQWWRDAIAAIYAGGPVPDHEIVKPLAVAIDRYDLPREHFEMLLHAREFDLEDLSPANMDGLLNYADFTSTPLLKLAVKITGDEEEMEPVHAVAVNYALMGILRAVPFHARQRRNYLPTDMMSEHGVTLKALYEMKPEPGLQAVVKEIAAHFVPRIRTGNRLLRAAQGLAGQYHGQMRRNRFDPFSPRLGIPPYFRELRLFCACMDILKK